MSELCLNFLIKTSTKTKLFEIKSRHNICIVKIKYKSFLFVFIKILEFYIKVIVEKDSIFFTSAS